MAKLYLRDVGSHPERDLEVTLFPDGELQFEADNGKYVHINIIMAGVKELLDFLLKETGEATEKEKELEEWKIRSADLSLTISDLDLLVFDLRGENYALRERVENLEKMITRSA